MHGAHRDQWMDTTPFLPTGYLLRRMLALSRGLGDFDFGSAYCQQPAIHGPLQLSALRFLILASDGIWDVFTDAQADNTAPPPPAISTLTTSVSYLPTHGYFSAARHSTSSARR